MKEILKRIIFTIFLSLIVSFSYGQGWKYNSGGNAFDGKYRTAHVIGIGDKFPYESPIFVINLFEDKNLNIYVSDAGYAGCDNKSALIKFDNDDQIYTFSITTDSEKGTWFLSSSSKLSKLDLIEKIKAGSTMNVRIKSDCNQNDLIFSLNGSTAAINFVLRDYLVKLKQVEQDRKLKDELYDEKMKQVSEILASGEKIKAKLKYNADIYYEYYFQNESRFIKLLYKGVKGLNSDEEIIFSEYDEKEEYCKLHKIPNNELSSDTVFYIKKYCIDLETVQKLD